VAWKILRGAMPASTESVTVGGVADQLAVDSARTQVTPKLMESFIAQIPCCAEVRCG